jgi:hypothetical protein
MNGTVESSCDVQDDIRPRKYMPRSSLRVGGGAVDGGHPRTDAQTACAVDTNILVRLITRDDRKQIESAEEFVPKGAWVSHLVPAETSWLLHSVYDRTRYRHSGTTPVCQMQSCSPNGPSFRRLANLCCSVLVNQ